MHLPVEGSSGIEDQYFNEAPLSDGEIYCKIRDYQIKGKKIQENRWWKRLSPHRSRNLKNITKHKDRAAAYDSLREIPGIIAGMKISTSHKDSASRCDEVN